MLPVDPHDVQQHSIYLASWGVELTIIIYNGRQYFVMRQICTILKIKFDTQLESLQERELMEGMLIKLPVRTSKGSRDSWCIDIEAVGAWMIIISDRRVRSESRPNLLKLQRDIMSAARRVMFGEVDSYATKQEVHDLRRYTWFLERQIVEGQQPRLLMPESDDE